MRITDIEPYRKDLEEFDLTDEQKLEFANAMLSIVEHFVDKAFGKHPVQLALQEASATRRKKKKSE